MNLIRWLQSLFSQRGKSLWIYRAGMDKANAGDFAGAIADYTATIQAPETPNDIKAMATYNRALAYSAIHEDDKAADDLAAMLKMPGLSEEIKTAAHRRRERIRKRSERSEEENERN